MKFAAILVSLIGYTAAAPALIWKNSRTGASMKHSSELTDASKLFASTVKSSSSTDRSLSTVFFLVGRDEHGNEALSHLTSNGLLPNTSAKYEDAHSIHYHVDGIESAHKVADHAMKGLKSKKSDGHVIEASLTQFNRKLEALHEDISIVGESEILPSGQMIPKAKKEQRKEGRKLEAAKVIVVHVDANDHLSLDDAVSSAIDSEKVGTVVLSSIRSTEEVKRERSLAARQRFNLMNKVNNKNSRVSRRLEDAQGDDAADDDAEAEEEGTYYVNMTPNILAGIMFIIFFLFVAYTGLTCMNLIDGQDVYVSKYPVIGREA
mmetsp:Transcript_12537/g.15752  ORF Transcript_12537/g.15752 Transcript_12537/m.15752 type:complete len:320 (+) Transcript_12537:137-1096(+)|eukprot:CAMPEP_0172502260 /NCGR_PEP_ID=MMETSP1066-20121228/158277_1 /TAXON_ID=671091 /ORGANISM="Coscinodiscus wailesii, Strain CCMP2513" /LENGTH=319 /DNA_ID=CAMNT_0013277453 /DNA_START=135 /DNA_END=1094 /DNA_ORIENTATION=+